MRVVCSGNENKGGGMENENKGRSNLYTQGKLWRVNVGFGVEAT
jgi:hypothetical protein